MADKFPGDLSGEIAALRAEVNELKALIKARPALTQASQGWLLKDMSIPSVGSGEVHIGASDGDFYVSTENGTKRIPDITRGPASAYPSSFTSPATIGSNPTAANYNALRADAAMLQVCSRSTIDALETAGVLAPH